LTLQHISKNNVELMLSLGTKWAKLVGGISAGTFTRVQLAQNLRDLRGLFQTMLNLFMLQLSLDHAGRVNMNDRCRLRVCPDCPDKFICLTENIAAVLRCRQCGVKRFYTVNTRNGKLFTSEQEVYTGSDTGCPLAVCSGHCITCGHIEPERAFALENWLMDEYQHAVRFTPGLGEKLNILVDNRVGVQPLHTQYKQQAALHYGQYYSPLTRITKHSMNTGRLVQLMVRSAQPSFMTIADFVDLLDPEPEVFRGFDVEKYRSEKSKGFPPELIEYLKSVDSDPTIVGARPAIVGDGPAAGSAAFHHLALCWTSPMFKIESALSVRDKDDFLFMAHDSMSQAEASNRILLTTPDYAAEEAYTRQIRDLIWKREKFDTCVSLANYNKLFQANLPELDDPEKQK